ncbi:universal stress protein [Streptomyces nymphaeiformis]|uniref:Nucleotide-binding universal stress UspA family protein n=1 Tax=Streptomyces nymphaeiformis TaxID=2663842 RepID=A0A7W7U504_9ACTN|nr:universal stress protein [Streptomyces nymphaeiformis]MBB4984282.1 nucleotide-binding universal stress UspA family protein [Streptomyces nymphaeiformis]
MTQGIVVGLDGTDQANAAAQWAAEEAELRGTGVDLVHVKETSPDVLLPFAAREPDEPWAEDLLARTAAGLRERHPDLSVTTRLLPSEPVARLVAVAEESDLLVLGSRALGGTTGYLIGSVGMSVAGLVERPVVLVRALDTSPPQGPVVVGVDLRQPVDTVLGFAFEEAARRLARVQVVYAQQLPVYATLGPAMVPDVRLTVAPEIQRSLDDLLEPWRTKFPDVMATGRVTTGSAGQELVHTASDAALVVVGRRTRGSTLGARIGSVAHAVLHHSRSPVALVPHG